MSQKNIYILATDTCYGIACAIDEVKSYEKIYKMKRRNFSNPLSILVEDFNRLEENSYLNDEQIDFLKNYPLPFTILCECPAIHVLLHFDDDTHFYKNKDVYDKIAIRIAHTPSQKKLLKKVGPLFLTSANISGQKESFTFNDIKDAFEEYDHIIHTIDTYDLTPDLKSSDIFEFINESTDVQYLRKNS